MQVICFQSAFLQVILKLLGLDKIRDLLTSSDLINNLEVIKPISTCTAKCINSFDRLIVTLQRKWNDTTGDLSFPTPKHDALLRGRGRG